MTKSKILRRLAMAPLALGLALLAAGCENPVGENGSDHPNGVVFMQGGAEVATYTHVGRVKTGSIRVPAGQDVTVFVQLTTPGGGRSEMDGIEYSMQDPIVLLTSFATATQLSTDALRITGKLAGTTTMEVPIRHGGHLEFNAIVDVVVE